MYESFIRVHRGLNGEDLYIDLDYEKFKKEMSALVLAHFMMSEIGDIVDELDAEMEPSSLE